MKPIYILSALVLSVLISIFIYEDVRSSQDYVDSEKVRQVDLISDVYDVDLE